MVEINTKACTGCGICAGDCVSGTLKMADGKVISKGSSCLECGHCAALCPEEAIIVSGTDPSEAIEYDPATFKIEPERLLNLIKYRRSIRNFEQRDLSDEDIAMLIEAGRYSPTSANRQYVRFVVTGMETTKKLVPITLEHLSNIDPKEMTDPDKPRFTTWYTDYVPIWKIWNSIYKKSGRDLVFGGAPNLILAVVPKGCEVDGSIAACAMEFMAASLGVGACYIGFGGVGLAQNPQAREILGLTEDENIAITLAVGYHKLDYKRTVVRKPANCVRIP